MHTYIYLLNQKQSNTHVENSPYYIVEVMNAANTAIPIN